MTDDHEKEEHKTTEASSRSSFEDLGQKTDNVTTTSEEAATPPVEYPTGIAFYGLVAALVLNIFVIALDQTIVATAIPKITDEFKGLEKVGWYASAYFMTFGGFQSTWGKVFKYFPLKASFLISMLLFEVGSLMCGVARDANTLIAGRAVAGLGGAGIATGAYVIVAFAVEPRLRASYNGIMAATYGVSAIAGPLLGGVFSDKVTWRWCFYINLPIGGMTAAIVLVFFRTPAAAAPKAASWKEKLIQMDFGGAVLVMALIVSFILAMERGGQTEAWNSSVVIGLLVGSVLFAVAFVCLELYLGESGMIPPRLFKRRSVWVGGMFQLCLGAAYFLVLYYLPIYFQSVKGASPINSGVRNLPMIIPVVIASIVGGVTVTMTGRSGIVAVIGSILAVISSGLLYTLEINSSAGKWIGYQVIGGFGWGLAWMCSMTITQGYAKMEDMSISVAINLFLQLLGGALSVPAAQSGFVNTLVKTMARTSPEINPFQVVVTGATQIRNTFPAEAVPGIIEAYMEGIKVAFILVTSFSALAVVFAFMLDMRPLPANRENKEVAIGGA